MGSRKNKKLLAVSLSVLLAFTAATGVLCGELREVTEAYAKSQNELASLYSRCSELKAENDSLSETNEKLWEALGAAHSDARILAFEYISNAQEIETLNETVSELNSRLEARTLDLSDYEFHVACSIVMGEAGGESDRGIMLLAQALIDGCQKNGVLPSQLRSLYQYQGYNENYTERVENAVTAVFKEGRRVIDDTVLYMYNSAMVSSAWHESRPFVTQEGNIRFFK